MNRTFQAIDRDSNQVTFELLEPTHEIETEGDMQRLKAYSEALKIGILPKESMRQILADNGIWDDENDQRFHTSMKRIIKLERELSDANHRGSDEECTNIAGELSKERMNMLKLFMIPNTVFGCSCEGYAETVKIEAMMAASVIVKGTKNRYWNTYTDYVLERDLHPNSTVAIEAQVLKSAIEEERHNKTIQEYPEYKWLKTMTSDLRERIESEIETAKREMIDKVKDNLNDEVESETSRATDQTD